MNPDSFTTRIEDFDKRTLERRAQRLQELTPIQTDGRLFASQREWDYAGEASESYINGNYRSTIFCCACAVDQIFKYEYLKVTGHEYKDIERCTFGQVIYRCSDVSSLQPYIQQAKTLNNLRNNIAAHPVFIDLPTSTELERETRNQLILKDINTLVELVGIFDPELKNKIKKTNLVSEVEGKTYNFGKIIQGQQEIPLNINGFWFLIEKDILQFLANRSWTILREIAEGLYGVNDSITTE